MTNSNDQFQDPEQKPGPATASNPDETAENGTPPERTPPGRPASLEGGPDQNEDRASAEGLDEDAALASEPTLEQVAEEASQVARTMLSFYPKVKKPVVRWRLEAETIWVDIEGDPSGRLIGRRGQTIDALQHVISKIVSHKFRRKITINVDAEKYRRRHREKLEKLARMTADYVAETNEPRALDPMSPADRRFIHIALKGRNDVITASEGKEPNRFVVIWPNTEEE
jgi:spoIIIJ-associated protein